MPHAVCPNIWPKIPESYSQTQLLHLPYNSQKADFRLLYHSHLCKQGGMRPRGVPLHCPIILRKKEKVRISLVFLWTCDAATYLLISSPLKIELNIFSIVLQKW